MRDGGGRTVLLRHAKAVTASCGGYKEERALAEFVIDFIHDRGQDEENTNVALRVLSPVVPHIGEHVWITTEDEAEAGGSLWDVTEVFYFLRTLEGRVMPNVMVWVVPVESDDEAGATLEGSGGQEE